MEEKNLSPPTQRHLAAGTARTMRLAAARPDHIAIDFVHAWEGELVASLDCLSAFQLCMQSGAWSTASCKRTGLARRFVVQRLEAHGVGSDVRTGLHWPSAVVRLEKQISWPWSQRVLPILWIRCDNGPSLVPQKQSEMLRRRECPCEPTPGPCAFRCRPSRLTAAGDAFPPRRGP